MTRSGGDFRPAGLWNEAVAAFLADLLDGSDVVGLPPELSDLPGAAARASTRMMRAASSADLRYPSIGRALHDVIVAEVIADRLQRRAGAAVDLDALVGLVASTLDYFAELSGSWHEGSSLTHGVVIAGDPTGVEPVVAEVVYPGRLSTRKRTPLLFDGTQSALIVDMSGHVVRGVERSSLPARGQSPADLRAFDEVPGLSGALTAAASAAFHGVGFYLQADHSTWIFDEGALLFVRRGIHWKSIAFESLTRTLTDLGHTSPDIAQRLARAALRLSMQGHGAILAIAGSRRTLGTVVQPKDRVPIAGDITTADVDDDLRHLLRLHDVSSASGLARLARLDGATIIDRAGNVAAYGAIVRSADSQDEGARSAAARALSAVADVSLSVSDDGPITVYHQGDVALQVL